MLLCSHKVETESWAMSDLIRMFDELSAPESVAGGAGEVFTGGTLPGHETWHVARDARGCPAILVEADQHQATTNPAVSLENLRVEHSAHCTIRADAGRVTSGQFSLIQCLSENRALHECFLRTMDGVLQGIREPAAAGDLTAIVNHLVDLFQLVRRAGSRSAMGLWGELFLITQASEPLALIRAWHAEAEERFDFSAGSEHIEVKVAADRTRRHYFSYEQAHPPTGSITVVVSFFVEAQTNGLSLGALWDQVGDLCGDDVELRMKVDRVCAAAVGSDLAMARQASYNQQLADESLAYFDVRSIPRVLREQPRGVSEIRFRSDMGLAEPLAKDSVVLAGALLQACVND